MRGVAEQRDASRAPVLDRRPVAQHPHFPGVDQQDRTEPVTGSLMPSLTAWATPSAAMCRWLRFTARVDAALAETLVERMTRGPTPGLYVVCHGEVEAKQAMAA